MSNMDASRMLLERLIDTKGLAVRTNQHDDAFWYTSGRPGPYYINTQNIAGAHAAKHLLTQITNLLKETESRERQVIEIAAMINQTVQDDPSYLKSIDTLVDYYLSHSSTRPSIISGGERRDWFFSIPVAARLGIPHIFLFKSGDLFVTDHEGKPLDLAIKDMEVLHVSDIINQASSYVNRWIPILSKAGVSLTETLTVAVRSQVGRDSLARSHVHVVAPLSVDPSLFKQALDLELIPTYAYNEIIQFYDSPREWTRRYLSEVNLEQSEVLDPVKRERLSFFKENDIYHLKEEFPRFFQ
ncbi:hypothetical protein [Paenibacillus mendelii]|uniref:Phosphoribosyltransferase n=1 Tax=Paenibacillus mendelii TaxID=206163 RepID=A0ABV6JHL4_9BACL|nr:hypothetical protein [Paenibacillus mendelii]MCQ6557189.1 hypothetical protein [Paenibacillus mendelii]